MQKTTFLLTPEMNHRTVLLQFMITQHQTLHQIIMIFTMKQTNIIAW